MRLRGQLAQLCLRLLDGIALGAEGGVAQAGAARLVIEAARTACVIEAARAACVIEAARAAVVARRALARTAGALAPITRTPVAATRPVAKAAGGRRLGLAGTGTVVAAHGHQRLDGPGRGGRRGGLRGGIGLAAGRFGCLRRCGFRSCWRAFGGRCNRFFFWCRNRLGARGGFQLGHGGADALGVAAGVGRFQRLGGFQHGAVVRAHRCLRLLALGALAVEGLVDRLAEGVPQPLLVLAIQRHRLGLGLPALLQRAHGVDAQLGRGAQGLGLLDQRLAARGAVLLRRLQRQRGAMDGLLPARLQLGELLFRQVTGVAPALGELVDLAVDGLPVAALAGVGVAGGPGAHFVDQRLALRLVLGRLGAHAGDPLVDEDVGGADGAVEALPQRVVGRAALVGGLPLLAQLADGVLQLAAAHGGGQLDAGLQRGGGGFFNVFLGFSPRLVCAGSFVFRSGRRCFGFRCGCVGRLGGGARRGLGRGNIGRRRSFRGRRGFGRRRGGLGRRLAGLRFSGRALDLALDQQCLGARHQLLAHLVGAPALPAFQLAGGNQRGVHARLQRVVDQPAVRLERLAQRLGGAVHVLGVAGGHGLLQQHDTGFDRLVRGGALLGVDLGPRRLVGGGRLAGRGLAARGAQRVGPHRHRRQRRAGIGRRRHRLRQGSAKGVPHRRQLGLRGFHLRRVAQVDAGPLRLGQQRRGLLVPLRHVGGQAGLLCLRLLPRLGRQQLDALRQQDGGLALHHHALLQVFHHLDAQGQLRAQAGQRLARQRRAGLGGVALPGQGVGDVQARRMQQGLGLGLPFGGHRLLALGAAQLVELFTQRAGSALVLGRQFLEHLLHLLGRRFAGQPVAHALGALARGGGREHAAGQRVQRMGLGGRTGLAVRLGWRVFRFAGKGEHAARCSSIKGQARRPGAPEGGIFAGICPAPDCRSCAWPVIGLSARGQRQFGAR